MLCQLSYRGETLARSPDSNSQPGKKWIEEAPWRQKGTMPPPGIAPGLPAPQAGVLLLYYSGGWRIRVSIPVLNLAKVVCYHVQQSPAEKHGCAHRDSNPNLILGRDKYYPCTMSAQYCARESCCVLAIFFFVEYRKKKKNRKKKSVHLTRFERVISCV